MRRKRLLCVCLVLALLLAAPVRAEELTGTEETPPAQEETVLETPETPEVPDPPDISPDGSDNPDNPDNQENPDDPDDPDNQDDPDDPENPNNPEDPETPEGGGPEADEEEESEDGEVEEGESEEEDEEEEEPEEDEPAAISDEPVIYVEVPAMGRIVVNPYGLEVKLGDLISTDQIVSELMPIVSYSEVPMAVLASAVGCAGPDSDAVFVSAPLQDGSKELFMYAEFQSAYDASGGGAYWSGAYTGAPNQLPVTARSAAPREVLRLDAADGMIPACGAFRLFGSASLPAEGMWRAQDTVQVTLTFTFVPIEQPVASINLMDLTDFTDVME